MGRQFLSVAGPLDDDLVAGVGQPVQGAVAQDGIIEEAEPFLHGPVAGDDAAGDPVSADDQLVKVGGLLAGEPVEAQVGQDEQVRGKEGAEGALHPSSVLSRIRARMITRAEPFPARTKCWSQSRCSGASRTPYFSLTIPPPPIITFQSQGSAFGHSFTSPSISSLTDY